MARMLGSFTRPWCPYCRNSHGIGPDCPDVSPSKRAQKTREKRQWRQEEEVNKYTSAEDPFPDEDLDDIQARFDTGEKHVTASPVPYASVVNPQTGRGMATGGNMPEPCTGRICAGSGCSHEFVDKKVEERRRAFAETHAKRGYTVSVYFPPEAPWDEIDLFIDAAADRAYSIPRETWDPFIVGQAGDILGIDGPEEAA